MAQWKVIQRDCYPGHKEKKLKKKQKQLIDNIFQNLETYIILIESNGNPDLIKRNNTFVHEEKNGLYAIDQRPPAGGNQYRLYIYPDVENLTLYVLIIGDKKTQSSDIKEAHKDIGRIRNGK